MRRLLEYVLELPEDALPSLSIQDAALCHLCRINGGQQFADVGEMDQIERRIQLWLSSAAPGEIGSEGRRNQTLVRELVDRVQSDAVDTMARDELDLLETVYAFAQSAQRAELFERVRRLIAPRRARIAARRASLPQVSGLPTLSTRYLVVRPDDILSAPQREVRVLAGVQLPARGPVLLHTGHVRVLGDVPDATTLVVEQADCVVDGCVLGRVASSGSCEILENISGVVISRNGDVRARHIIDNAFVVSKRGRVQCRKVQGARMVFAGDKLQVAEGAVRSHLIAPTVAIGETVSSGSIHASARITAGRLCGEDAPLEVYLRRGLSCRDYGEDPGKNMTADVRRALRTRSDLHCARSQMSMSLRAAEQAAETCLMYLLAVDDTARIAEDICASQRRLDVLNRIVLGLRALYAEAEAREHGDEDGHEDAPSAVLARIDGEVAAILAEAPANDPAHAMYRELTETRGEFGRQKSKRALLHSTLEDIVSKLERWRSEADRLRAAIRRSQERLTHNGRVRDMLGGSPASKSKVLTFHRVIESARAEAPDSRMRQRAQSPFIAAMSRTIDKRVAEARKLKSETDTLYAQFTDAQRLVWNSYQMRIDDDDGIDRTLTVEGEFSGDVRLFADPRFESDANSALPREMAFIPPPSAGGRARYLCSGGRIRETVLTPAEEAPEEPELTVA